MASIKLLAPAGSLSVLKSAVACGADEVYFGGKLFNARQGAENFSKEDIREAAAFCRLHQVKTLLTVNTLVWPSEWSRLCKYLEEILPLGIDAVIVQDVGVAAHIAAHYPAVELHASTQMSVASRAGVEQLLELGFSRVVLGRELSLEEIRHIYEATKAQLEVFIHGALCYSYSGQCLLSSFHSGKEGIGSHSANRGQCSMPCRFPYVIDGEPGHFFNLKDREGSAYLDALAQAGVYSLKIEGRLKSEAYVRGTTRYYKERIEGEAPYQVQKEEVAALYNRGSFTGGYYENKDGMVELRYPKHFGVAVGSVTDVQGPTLWIRSREALAAGDVLEIDHGREISEIRLSEGMIRGEGREARFKLAGTFTKGDRVRRLVSRRLIEKMQGLRYEKPKLPIQLEVSLVRNQPLRMAAVFQGERYEVTGDPPAEALNAPLSEADLRRQMLKLGGTPFLCHDSDLRITMDPQLFISLGQINSLRRALIQKLEQALLAASPRIPEDKLRQRAAFARQGAAAVFPALPKRMIHMDSELFADLSENDWLILPLEQPEQLEVLGEKHPKEGILAELPPAWKEDREKQIRQWMQAWTKQGIRRFLCQNYAGLYLAKQLGAEGYAGEGLGVTNLCAAQTMQSLASGVTCSVELPPGEGDQLYAQGVRAMELAQGRIRYMVSPQCPYKERYGCEPLPGGHRLSILDRTGEAMTALCHCDGCYMELFSEKPLKRKVHPENSGIYRY